MPYTYWMNKIGLCFFSWRNEKATFTEKLVEIKTEKLPGGCHTVFYSLVLDLRLSLTTYFRPRPRCWSHLCWNAGRKTENIKATSPNLHPLHPSQFISLPNLCSNYAFYQRSISIYFRQSLDFCGQISEINSLMFSNKHCEVLVSCSDWRTE